MKQGWEIKKLGEVLKIQNGYAFNSKLFSIEEGTPLIRIRDIKNGIGTEINFNGPYDKKYEVKAGDFLIGMDGAFGCYEWKGDIALLNQRVCRLQDFSKMLDSKFIFYGINKYLKAIEDITAFATVKHISSKQIENIEILLPPLPEQQRIVAILDEAFAAIVKAKANAEQNLKNAKELFESYLQSVFENKGEGWEEKRLGEVVDNIMTGPFGSMLHKSDYVENGIPVINPQNIIDGKIVSFQKTMINELTFNRLEKYALKYGDIVIARRGEMGRCAIVKNHNVGWLCGTGSFVIRVNKKKMDCDFLNIFLSSSEVKKQLEKSSIGATMSNLNQSILSEILLNVPPVIEQQTIVQKLDALSAQTKKLEAIYQQHINDLEELKKSILQKAFNGELNTTRAADADRLLHTMDETANAAALAGLTPTLLDGLLVDES